MAQDYQIPQWLTKVFICDNLMSHEERVPGLQVLIFTPEYATSKGENYGSEMFRIRVEYGTNRSSYTKYYILKKAFEDESVNEYFSQYNLYDTEIKYYRDYLPKFRQILRSTTGGNTRLSPSLIYANHPIMVIEDMRPEGFQTVKANERQDFSTAKVSLQKLAQLHASSIIYDRLSGGSLQKSPWRLFEAEGGFVNVLVSKLDTLITEMRHWEAEFQTIIPKLQVIHKNFYEIGRRYVRPSVEFGGCYIHGDAQLNNILVRRDSEGIEALLIDLQIGCWSSPALDILYFIFTSMKEEDYQEEEKRRELISHYYEEWSGVLNQFFYFPVPTLQQLHQEIDSKFIHGELVPVEGDVLITKVTLLSHSPLRRRPG